MEINRIVNELKKNIGLLFFSILFCTVFFVLQVHTPLQLDDFEFMYVRVVSDAGVRYTDSRIESFCDFLNTIEAHRVTSNGRLADVFAICSLNFLNRYVFAAVNTAVAFFLIIIISKLIFNRVTPYLLIIIISSLLLFLPNIPANVFWLCGTCNYTWGACMVVAFMLLYKSCTNRSDNRNIKLGICIVLAIVCSAYHEAIGVPLLFSFLLKLICYSIKTKRINKVDLFIVVALLIGVFVCVSAPGVSSRIDSALGAEALNVLYKKIIVCFLCLPAVLLIILSLFKGNCENLERLRLLFAIGGGLLVGGIVFLAGGGSTLYHGGMRYYFCFSCVLVALEAFQTLILKNKIVVGGGAFVVLSYWLLVNIPANVNLTRIVNSSIKNQIVNSSVILDLTKNRRVLNDARILHALPSFPGLSKRGMVLRGEEFYAIINVLMTDSNDLLLFEKVAEGSSVVRNKSGIWIIRLPHDYIPIQDEPMDIRDTNNHLTALAVPFCSRQSIPEFCSTLFYKLTKKVSNCCKYSIYSDENVYYVLLSSDAPENHIVNVRVSHRQKNYESKTIKVKLSNH